MSRPLALCAVLVISIGCATGGTATTPIASIQTQVTAAPTVAPTGAPTVSATASASPTPVKTDVAVTVAPTNSPSPTPSGPAKLPVIRQSSTGVPVAGGTYVTSPAGFFPGLTLTIPDGWAAKETDSGELSLVQRGSDDKTLLLLKDLSATVTNNQDGTVGQPLAGVGTTAPEILDWLSNLSDVTLLSEPKPATVGNGIAGTELTLTTSDTANFDWDDCPDNPRCVSLFTDTKHWGGDFYGIGGDEVSRIFVATAHYPTADHTFYVLLDVPSAEDLEPFAQVAQPIIDSITLPTTYIPN